MTKQPRDDDIRLERLMPWAESERYRSICLLGAGGMGEVHRAHDTKLGREVALKAILPKYLHRHRVLSRFKREMSALSTVKHPNIVELFDVHDEGPQGMYYAMELVDGPSWREHVTDLAPVDVVELFLPIVAAVASINERGLFHRDIKVDNIRLTSGGVPKLMDFGLALFDSTSHTNISRTGEIVGTLAYLPPEVLYGNEYDGRGDVYELGVTLYESLTGCKPFTNNELLGLLEGNESPIVRPSLRNRAVCRQLDAIVLRAMAADPAERYRTAAALDEALSGWLEQQRAATADVITCPSPTYSRQSKAASGSAAPEAEGASAAGASVGRASVGRASVGRASVGRASVASAAATSAAISAATPADSAATVAGDHRQRRSSSQYQFILLAVIVGTLVVLAAATALFIRYQRYGDMRASSHPGTELTATGEFAIGTPRLASLDSLLIPLEGQLVGNCEITVAEQEPLFVPLSQASRLSRRRSLLTVMLPRPIVNETEVVVTAAGREKRALLDPTAFIDGLLSPVENLTPAKLRLIEGAFSWAHKRFASRRLTGGLVGKARQVGLRELEAAHLAALTEHGLSEQVMNGLARSLPLLFAKRLANDDLAHRLLPLRYLESLWPELLSPAPPWGAFSALLGLEFLRPDEDLSLRGWRIVVQESLLTNDTGGSHRWLWMTHPKDRRLNPKYVQTFSATLQITLMSLPEHDEKTDMPPRQPDMRSAFSKTFTITEVDAPVYAVALEIRCFNKNLYFAPQLNGQALGAIFNTAQSIGSQSDFALKAHLRHMLVILPFPATLISPGENVIDMAIKSVTGENPTVYPSLRRLLILAGQ